MRGRTFFLLFFLCASIPFAAAKLSLSYGWFDTGATNKGEWPEQEMQLIPPLSTGDMHWTVAYVTANKCAQECFSALTILQQLYTGLGRKQLGAQVVLVTSDATNAAMVHTQFPVIKTNIAEASAEKNIIALEHDFVIINQHGLVLLRYAFDDSMATQTAANIRSDLLRLINYDRSRL